MSSLYRKHQYNLASPNSSKKNHKFSDQITSASKPEKSLAISFPVSEVSEIFLMNPQ